MQPHGRGHHGGLRVCRPHAATLSTASSPHRSVAVWSPPGCDLFSVHQEHTTFVADDFVRFTLPKYQSSCDGENWRQIASVGSSVCFTSHSNHPRIQHIVRLPVAKADRCRRRVKRAKGSAKLLESRTHRSSWAAGIQASMGVSPQAKRYKVDRSVEGSDDGDEACVGQVRSKWPSWQSVGWSLVYVDLMASFLFSAHQRMTSWAELCLGQIPKLRYTCVDALWKRSPLFGVAPHLRIKHLQCL